MAVVRSIMRVRIVCDSIHGPRIYDLEGNEILKQAVRAVRWEWEVGQAPRAVITTLPASLEVEAEVEGLECGLAQQPHRERDGRMGAALQRAEREEIEAGGCTAFDTRPHGQRS